MECKNCKTILSESDKFCSHCGGKIINKRLTFKIIFQEFIENYFNWDNRIALTLIHMFTKPEEVINGYINGVRKRYMHPFSFFMLSLTLTGFFLYFSKGAYQEYFKEITSFTSSNPDNPFLTSDSFFIKNMNLITMVSVPIFALFSFILFRKSKYNFVEHTIINTYINASFGFVNITLSTFGLLVSKEIFGVSQNILFILQIIYFPYVYKRVFNLKLEQIFLKAIWFVLLLILFFIIIIIISFVIVLIAHNFFDINLMKH